MADSDRIDELIEENNSLKSVLADLVYLDSNGDILNMYNSDVDLGSVSDVGDFKEDLLAAQKRRTR